MSQVESTLQFTDESYTIGEFREKFHAPKVEVKKYEKEDGTFYGFRAGAKGGLVSKKVIEGDKRPKAITRVVNEHGEQLWMLHPIGDSGETIMEITE